jgi:geranylgeranyl pyrophosphate synthase
MLDQNTKTIYHKTALVTPPWLEPIQEELVLVEERLQATSQQQHAMLTSTIQNIFSAGGKRVRPALSLLTAGLFDADSDQAISLAAAVEMLHTATLVHDDLIDGAMIRRGSPTLNALWSPDIAVLAGDFLFARAASLISQVEIVPVMRLFANTLEIILNGEITQKFTKWQLDRDEYEARIYAKTGALFVLSTQSAAMLGGAYPEALQAVIAFGNHIGTAFQIVDDVLDYVGSAEKLGKPIGGDLRQGIFTLPAILYAETHPQDELFQAYLAQQVNGDSAVQTLIERIQASGAIEASLAEARERLAKGRQALAGLPASIYHQALLDLAVHLVDREL